MPDQFFTTLEQNLQGLAATKLHGTSTERPTAGASNATEGYSASNRSRTGPYRTAIIPTVHYPFAVRCLPRNDANVMRPYDDHSDAWASGIHTRSSPLAS